MIVAARCAALLIGPAAALADNNGVQYYLSLGDSLAAGEQPALPQGQNFGPDGYADQLYRIEQAKIPQLKLVKMGCGGETTSSMINALSTVDVPGLGPVPYEGLGDHFLQLPSGSQLAEAVNFLHTHRGFVSFVTIDIGGNDVTEERGGGIAAVIANLPVILGELREAAGPGVPLQSWASTTSSRGSTPPSGIRRRTSRARFRRRTRPSSAASHSTCCASASGRGCARLRRSVLTSTRTRPATA